MDLNSRNSNRGSLERTKRTQWTPLHTAKKIVKSSTILAEKSTFGNRRVSSGLFVDSGHKVYVKCSLNLYNNPLFGIFNSFSCLKSILKTREDKKIKKFYWSGGMSTLSSVSAVIEGRKKR